MNRLTRGFGVLGGVFLLGDLVAFFLPVTVCTQKNYPSLRWSEFDFLKGVPSKQFPYDADNAGAMAGSQSIWIIGLMLLPVVLALAVAVWGMISHAGRLYQMIGVLIICILYAVMMINLPFLWPEEPGICQYTRGVAAILHLFFSGAGCLMMVLSFILSQKKTGQPEAMAGIPQVEVMKQEQRQAKYDSVLGEEKIAWPGQKVSVATGQPVQGTSAVMQQPGQNDFGTMQQPGAVGQPVQGTSAVMQQSGQNDYGMMQQLGAIEQPVQEIPPYVPGNPRGVLVGLKGIYAGAQIPLKDGEVVSLGRGAENNLVFEGQVKVSRKHCKIRWDGSLQQFFIVDTSSNGTFLSGSDECLAHNLELSMDPGTVLEIGDETNVFRLE